MGAVEAVRETWQSAESTNIYDDRGKKNFRKKYWSSTTPKTLQRLRIGSIITQEGGSPKIYYYGCATMTQGDVVLPDREQNDPV
jgi:hypothetical protein